MAEIEDVGDCEEQMKILVKSLKEKKDIILSVNATVKQLKEIISREFSASEEQLCFIYAGKILNDEDHLSKYNIKDGTTVHLVIKSANKESDGQGSSASREPVNIAATPFGLGNFGGLLGLSNLGFGSANSMNREQLFQSELFTNPDTLRNLMENPMVKQIISNPQILQSLLSINPQMRELLEANPDIANVLSNPELLQQAFSLAKNPTTLQELIRVATDGGTEGLISAIPRLYRDVQEPMFNAATSESATGGGRNTSSTDGGTSSTATHSDAAAAAAGATNPALNSSGVQSIVQQMMQNPQLMNNLVQSPYMQSMMQTLAQPNNSQLLEQSNPPLIEGSPAAEAALPNLAQQLNDPDVQRLVGNPRALQAMLDIQRSMQILQDEAPGLVGTQNTPTMTTPSGTTGSTDQTAASSGDQYSQMFRTMAGSVDNNSSGQTSEVRFELQLSQLVSMGFMDRQANIDALALTSGNVHAAVDKLLQMK